MSEAKAKKETKPKAEKAPKAPKVVKEKAPKVERERQNGQTRPVVGSKTGLVWDIADAISQKMRRPALRNEVFDELDRVTKQQFSAAMAGTQYSRWCAFHNVTAELKKFKQADRAEKDAAVKKEKAEKKAKSDAEKKAKADKASADVQKAATAAAAKKKAA